jgi:hypothetical protein
VSPTPTPRWLDRAFALAGVRLLVWLVVATIFAAPELANPGHMTAVFDDHYFTTYDDVTWRTIVRYGQLPDWSPWHCGGVPAMGNPQGTTLSPDFLLRLLLGVSTGRRLTVVLMLVLGMEGLFRLAREWDGSPIGSAAAAACWVTTGWFAQSLASGWLNHLGFLLLPWMILSLVRGIRRPAWRFAGGFFVAWALEMGGTYSVPHGIIALGLVCFAETVRIVWTPRSERDVRWFAPALSLATILGASFVFGAMRWLPILSVLHEHPRVWFHSESIAPSTLLDLMLHWQGRPAFVGPTLLVVALLGVLFADRRAALALGLAAVFVALALGDQGPLSPFVLLRRLPLYAQLRAPERFMAAAAMFACLSAARALTVIEDTAARASERLFRIKLIGGVVGALVAAALGAVMIATCITRDDRDTGVYSFDAPLERDAPFRQSRGDRWDVQVFPAVNLGVLECFEEVPFPQSPRLRGDLPAEEYPKDPSAAQVTRTKWSPNEIVLAVTASTPTTIYVNQNWHRAWSSNVGKVRDEEGLLAIDVPAGSHELVLRHRDPVVLVGFAITLLAHLAALAWLARLGRARFEELRARWRTLPATS